VTTSVFYKIEELVKLTAEGLPEDWVKEVKPQRNNRKNTVELLLFVTVVGNMIVESFVLDKRYTTFD
jgi:hypothetical protein